jgi:GH43 family beta-xylosidase
MPKNLEGKPATFVNPVYPYSFPDPFVLKFRGEYFAYCTGDAEDGNIFRILHSPNLVNWTYVGSAMEPLGSRPPFYWAPEVVYDNGKFYCYYSAGNEILMEIRVAVSERPDGGFVDAGVRLTKEEFAIDAHIFIDDDGTRYLFYATDFLEYSHIGTGTVVDKMIDWKTLSGDPRPVTRAKYDWQVYDPARKEKGGVRWHTVEGPTVLKRKGKYYEMFSGGNWQNMSYGVSFAVADSMKSKDEWRQFADGEKILPILRTIPEKVIGPGHNSVVRGPNNRELYCVYHRWTDAGRVLAIDRMDFAGDRIFVAGPSTTEQPVPFLPKGLEEIVIENNGWAIDGSRYSASPDARSELILGIGGPFLFETTFNFADAVSEGSFGFRFGDAEFILWPTERQATFRVGKARAKTLKLAKVLDPLVPHLLRVKVGLTTVQIMIDDPGQLIKGAFDAGGGELKLFAKGVHLDLASTQITRGFEELFEEDKVPIGLTISGTATCKNGYLEIAPSDGLANAVFDAPYENFEFAANVTVSGASATGEYGIQLSDGLAVSTLAIDPASRSISFSAADDERRVDLPDSFVGDEFRQLRIVFQDQRLLGYLDGILIGELPSQLNVASASIFGRAGISVEMLRLTEV